MSKFIPVQSVYGTDGTMNTVTTESNKYSLGRGRRTLALAGVVIVAIGLLAIALPFATGIALTTLVGVLLLLGGIVHAGHAITADTWKGSLWQVALAIVTIGAGIVLLVQPIVGLLSLTLLVIVYLFADGIVELGTSLRMERGSGRSWVAASGVLSFVLAGVLWAGFPTTAVWLVGVVVGISLLTTGLSMVAVSYVGQPVDEDVTPPVARPRGT